MESRYELLPLPGAAEEAARVATPLALTITCSPRQGIDRSIELARRLLDGGHRPIVHLAARMIEDEGRLEAIVEQLAGLGADDVFVVGGDVSEPRGPYASAVALLTALDGHPLRPRRIGVAAYPEGHPLIESAVLRASLHAKVALGADYATTQMCFDAAALRRWIAETRADGVALPLYIGVPGQVDRRRLLEVSMRVGVGVSLSVLRKQRGLSRLLGRPRHAADLLLDGLGDPARLPELGVAGVQYFTFNKLVATLDWERRRTAGAPARAAHA